MAAAGQSALSDRGEFPLAGLSADAVAVYFSRQDDVLRDGFELGERWATWGREVVT